MSIIATAVKHMLAAGMPAEAIVAAVAEMEQTPAQAADLVTERKRLRDRERMRQKRDSRAMSRDIGDKSDVAPAPAPPSSPSPRPLTLTTPTPPDVSTPTREATPIALFDRAMGFSEWWGTYPNKVGKAAAEKAYAVACRKIGGPDPPGVLMAGLRRAIASDQWSRGFIPHPTTWLNQGRWEDQPSSAPTPAPRGGFDAPRSDTRQLAREENLSRAFAAAQAVARARAEQ